MKQNYTITPPWRYGGLLLLFCSVTKLFGHFEMSLLFFGFDFGEAFQSWSWKWSYPTGYNNSVFTSCVKFLWTKAVGIFLALLKLMYKSYFWKACEVSVEPGGKFSQSFVIQMNICILTNEISFITMGTLSFALVKQSSLNPVSELLLNSSDVPFLCGTSCGFCR